MIISDLIIFICILLSAFFSGMEIAFISSNKIFIEVEKKQSGINAKFLNFITKNPSRFIATMLLGNNISLVIYGLFMGDRIIDFIFPEINFKFCWKIILWNLLLVNFINRVYLFNIFFFKFYLFFYLSNL